MVTDIKGVCSTCQQSDIGLRYATVKVDGDEYIKQRDNLDPDMYFLVSHLHQGNDWCQGGGDTPQAVYRKKAKE